MVAQQTGAQVIKLPLNDRRLPDVERPPELITSRSRDTGVGANVERNGRRPIRKRYQRRSRKVEMS